MPRLLLHLLRQLALTRAALRAARPHARETVRLATGALVLLLLALRQLPELVERLVDLGLLLFVPSAATGVAALRLFVLIAHLVALHLEDVGQVAGAGSAASAATTTAALLSLGDTDVAEQRFRPLQLLQRLLLRRERAAR